MLTDLSPADLPDGDPDENGGFSTLRPKLRQQILFAIFQLMKY